jgi:hypothetical protein
MNDTKWTGGTWRCRTHLLDAHIMIVVPGDDYVIITDAQVFGDEQADYTLIAAAPDLYDVCRQLVYADEHGDSEELANAVSAACKALAKARGEVTDD